MALVSGMAGYSGAHNHSDKKALGDEQVSNSTKVYVAVHSHKDGIDVSVYETPKEAFDAKVAIARERWDGRANQDGPDDHRSLSDDDVVDYYFDDSGAEHCIIRECDLVLRRGARPMPLDSETVACVRHMVANENTWPLPVLNMKRIEGDTTQFGQIGPRVGDPHAPCITLYRADGVMCVFKTVEQLIADGWAID